MLHNFPNLGYLLDDVPQHILDKLNKEVSSLDDTAPKANNTLAGNIKQEYFLETSRSIVEPYVLELLTHYNDGYGILTSLDAMSAGNPQPVKLGPLWVNFQEKGEFNPHHKHSGVMSFVIWLKVPFDIRKEENESPGIYSNTNSAGCFEFIYSNILGHTQNYQIPVDKSFEGKILMFPNKLMHGVYPFFSSNEYRISVAGNILMDVPEQ